MRAQKGPGGWILTPKNIGRDQQSVKGSSSEEII